ncbi:MAG: LysM domain-containing protein [Pseudomonadota bacterium]
MKPVRFIIFGALVLMVPFSIPFPLHGAILYKSYIVRQDKGADILCDVHIVRKNDSVRELLLQKGEMAEKDFSELLTLFRRINPHVGDISRIQEGEHIFIPIKRLKADALPGQSSGIVTIPFVTISKIQKLIRSNSEIHKVQKGECVSVLIARQFGPFPSSSYQTGIALFERANPSISNLDRIYPGQKIFIPRPSIQNESWFTSLFAGSETVLSSSRSEKIEFNPPSPLSQVASLLDANLINRGTYFFPVQGGSDIKLDLSQYPILEFKDGKRVLLLTREMKDADIHIIRSFWNQIEAVPLPADPSVEQLLDPLARVIPEISPNQSFFITDHGMSVGVRARWVITKKTNDHHQSLQTAVYLIDHDREKTSESVVRYLAGQGIRVKDIFRKDEPGKSLKSDPTEHVLSQDTGKGILRIPYSDSKRVFKEIISALGYTYSPNITISFPYAGIQVKALSNMITKPDGRLLMVDFEDLQGDAVNAISKTGFAIIQIRLNDDMETSLKRLIESLTISYTPNPVFFASRRPNDQNISLAFPGFLISPEKDQHTLITYEPIDEPVLSFLKEQHVRVVTIKPDGRYSGSSIIHNRKCRSMS